jgi:leucyl-tRNA synthetase
MAKDLEEMKTLTEKLTVQVTSKNDNQAAEFEMMKKTVYGVEGDVQAKINAMLLEIEGFIKARKRDKNDINAAMRNLQEKMRETQHESSYNRKAIENIATATVMILETMQMTLASEEQDENDRNSMALLGSRGTVQSGADG